MSLRVSVASCSRERERRFETFRIGENGVEDEDLGGKKKRGKWKKRIEISKNSEGGRKKIAPFHLWVFILLAPALFLAGGGTLLFFFSPYTHSLRSLPFASRSRLVTCEQTPIPHGQSPQQLLANRQPFPNQRAVVAGFEIFVLRVAVDLG